jgi:F0F1-type ATP synthase membrane subunit b/b'
MNIINNIVQDPDFWFACGFALFIFLAYKHIKNIIVKTIDNYIKQLVVRVQESDQLLEESKETLNKIEGKVLTLKAYEEKLITQAEESIAEFTEKQEQALLQAADYKKQETTNEIASLLSKHEKDLMSQLYSVVYKDVKSFFSNPENKISDPKVAKSFKITLH